MKTCYSLRVVYELELIDGWPAFRLATCLFSTVNKYSTNKIYSFVHNCEYNDDSSYNSGIIVGSLSI